MISFVPSCAAGGSLVRRSAESIFQVFLEPAQAFDDLRRVDAGVGKAHVVLRLPPERPPKVHARAHGDAGLLKHVSTQILDVAKTLSLRRGSHVREQVEGGVRLETTHAGDVVQSIGRDIATLPERRDDLPGPALIAGEPLEGAVLDEVI